MKKLILLLLIAIIGFPVYSQKNKLIKEIKGSEFRPKKIDRTYALNHAIKVGDNYYVVGKVYANEPRNLIIYTASYYVPADFKIYKLDAKMNVKEVVTIPGEIDGRFVWPFQLKRFGDHLVALYFLNNKKTLRQYLFAQKIDLKSFKTVGSPYKIAETTISKREKNIDCIFDVSITPDFKKMLITADRTNIVRSRRERKASQAQKNHTFTYWLIDSEFKLLSHQKNVKFGKGNTEIINQLFDNEGNLCLLGFESATKTKKKKKVFSDIDDDVDENDSKLVMKIIHANGESEDLSFANGEYFYSATMVLNPNTGNVAVVGLLGSGKNGAKGIFTQQVNLSTGEVLTEKKELFSESLVKEISELKPPTRKEKDKTKSKAAKEKPSKKDKKPDTKKRKAPTLDHIPLLVRLGAIHYNDSNELVVVCQKYYTYTVTYTTTNSKGQTYTYTVTYYVYGDIVSFKLDPEGQIESFGYVFHYYNSAAYLGNRDYSSLYANNKLFVITRISGGEIKLDNKPTELQPLKEQQTYKKGKYGMAKFVNVSDNELIHILMNKRKVVFSLMSVQVN